MLGILSVRKKARQGTTGYICVRKWDLSLKQDYCLLNIPEEWWTTIHSPFEQYSLEFVAERSLHYPSTTYI